MGRILAARMSEILGQVIIENATGAAGIIGVNRVRSARAGNEWHHSAWDFRNPIKFKFRQSAPRRAVQPVSR